MSWDKSSEGMGKWRFEKKYRGPIQVLMHPRLSPIEPSVKLQYLRQRTIFFQTVCADVHQTLAPTRYIHNQSNRKTSIEPSLWWSAVAYVQWLLCYSEPLSSFHLFCSNNNQSSMTRHKKLNSICVVRLSNWHHLSEVWNMAVGFGAFVVLHISIPR